MKTQCLSLDRISTLPENITEKILSLMPIRDALRTSILSKEWLYSWQSMPNLVFTEDMVNVPGCGELKKHKLVNAIFHVLLLHNGPTQLWFDLSVGKLQLDSELAQIISYLSRGNNLKKLFFINHEGFYRLPVSFFSMQGIERIQLKNCVFEPPLTFDGFSQLKSMRFFDVKVSVQMLQLFLSKCPLLEHINMLGDKEDLLESAEGGSKFTYVELLQCVPSIQHLDISTYYMKYLSAGGMPHQLPTSLVNLACLDLEVCLMAQNEISSLLCLIRSSPELEMIKIWMVDYEKLPVQRKTPANFLDPEEYLDLILDHLVILEMIMFRNLPFEIEFVKLIMAKSPVLNKVRITLDDDVSVDEEVKMLRDLVRVPFPRASLSAELVIRRP